MGARRILPWCLLGTLLIASFTLRAHARAGQEADVRTHPAGILYAPGELTAAQRAAGLRFAPDVPSADRRRILAAIAATRPEARTLIAEVDGMVEVHEGLSRSDAVGLAVLQHGTLSVHFDAPMLDQLGPATARHVIVHELGHIVDFALVPDSLVKRLDTGIPNTRPCPLSLEKTGPCSAREERFADTFAKWALGTDGPPQWIGYGVESPLSVPQWGRPLDRLAARYAAAARKS